MADKTDGGLDSTNHGLTGWAKSLFAYMDRDGWLKGILWTFFGGSFFNALILGTVAFLVSAKDSGCLTAYLLFLPICLGLKTIDEKTNKKENEQENI
ncbi:hypothetical protein NO1_1725 [Candidatus Termititenax aidoneus]|uniref:Uncharacterized protein n=1 Tax=Termititenax aidoneus TaxID=2218524 RepID=A0A388TEZ7_TERA1|nr:hypothetical protein NO1_1725 [Candidatus Termititenax aidoneus]